MRFSPDGRVFVAEKSGLIKVFASLSSTTPTVFADLRGRVDDYWDRGLLGMTLDPNFPATRTSTCCTRSTASTAGRCRAGMTRCPSPPGPDHRRLRHQRTALAADRVGQRRDRHRGHPDQGLVPAVPQPLPRRPAVRRRTARCTSRGGDGASFTNVDYGQFGGTTGVTVEEPVRRPAGRRRRHPDAADRRGRRAAEPEPAPPGRATRSSSTARSSASIPATGAGLPGNPLARQRRPQRPPDRRATGCATRSGSRSGPRRTRSGSATSAGTTGGDQPDRGPAGRRSPTSAGRASRVRPAVGVTRRAGLDVCSEPLHDPTGLLRPYFAYAHGDGRPRRDVPDRQLRDRRASRSTRAAPTRPRTTERCSSPTTRGTASGRCRRRRTACPTRPVETFVAGAANPVDLEIGPERRPLLRRLRRRDDPPRSRSRPNLPPTAVIKATPSSGPSPLTVALRRDRVSTDPRGRALTYSWDLDNDGSFGDSTSATPTVTFPDIRDASRSRLQVTDPSRRPARRPSTCSSTIPCRTPSSTRRPRRSTWQVGQAISFSGHATGRPGATLPASGLSWTLVLHHCPSNCHTHTVQSFTGVASGSFAAPDHDYPSYLELVLTATDSAAPHVDRQRPPRSARPST